MQDRAEDDLRLFPLLQQQFLLLSLALTNKHNYRQGKNKKFLTLYETKQQTFRKKRGKNSFALMVAFFIW